MCFVMSEPGKTYPVNKRESARKRPVLFTICSNEVEIKPISIIMQFRTARAESSGNVERWGLPGLEVCQSEVWWPARAGEVVGEFSKG